MELLNGIVCLKNTLLYIHDTTSTTSDDVNKYINTISLSASGSTEIEVFDINHTHICFKINNELLVGIILSTNDTVAIKDIISHILDDIYNAIQQQFEITNDKQSAYLPLCIFQIRCYKIFTDHFKAYKNPSCKSCILSKYRIPKHIIKPNDYIQMSDIESTHDDNRSIELISNQDASSHSSYTCKVCIIGDAATGKNQIVSRFVRDTFETEYKMTVGADFVQQSMKIDDKIVKLEIWNTAGAEKFRGLVTMYLRSCVCVILCYDVTNRATFESIIDWMNTIQDKQQSNCSIVLVANKIDLQDARQVSTAEGEAMASEFGVTFVETSAKHKVNIDTLFRIVAEEAYINQGQCSYDVYAPVCMMADDDHDKKSYFMSPADTFERPQMNQAETDKNSKFIDNVFADLENLFYILAFAIYPCHCFDLCICNNILGCICCICGNLCQKIFILAVIYPLIIVISLVMVLPSCIFVLIVRASKIETDTKDLAIREDALSHETCRKRFVRLIMQIIRSLFMFSVLAVYPVIITYVIIPRYGMNSDYIITACIGSYLCFILILQACGTYRGLKSFAKRRNELFQQTNDTETRFVPKTFQINIGSMIGILFIFYEIFQLTLFANHVISSNPTNYSANYGTESNSDQSPNDMIHKLTNLCYLSLYFVEVHRFEFYAYFGFICVGSLLLIFVIRYIFELNIYAFYKYSDKNDGAARDFYFHSFVGTIVYGHGSLQNVNQFICKIVSLLSDTLFLVILQKLLMLLLCRSASENVSYLVIDDTVQCWVGVHQLYATIALILIAYYIPICSMIAPMFDESQLQASTTKTFFSFTNTTEFVKPFLSTITLSKCFSLIVAQYIAKGDAFITIIAQSISMIVVLIFTINWSVTNLNKYGLTYNEPGFPFAVSMLVGFFGGFIGCMVQFLLWLGIITDGESFVLWIVLSIGSFIILIVAKCYHRKYNRFCVQKENINAIVRFDSNHFKVDNFRRL